MAEEKYSFTLTQIEAIGNIQNRLSVELCREKKIYDDSTSYYIQLKTVSSSKISSEQFTIDEAEKISGAILYVSANEASFPTQGNPKIEFKIDSRMKVQIIRRQNGWEFLLTVNKAAYKIQYAELQKLQELIFRAINTAKTNLEGGL